MSRAVFARRFREKVGATPVDYLTPWRMTLAAELLVNDRERFCEWRNRSITGRSTRSTRHSSARWAARRGVTPLLLK